MGCEKQPPDQHQKCDLGHDDQPKFKRKPTQRPFGMHVAVADVAGWRRVDGDKSLANVFQPTRIEAKLSKSFRSLRRCRAICFDVPDDPIAGMVLQAG